VDTEQEELGKRREIINRPQAKRDDAILAGANEAKTAASGRSEIFIFLKDH